jgi:hypothetical protein
MKRLEQVRLEVDSRRHTVTALSRAIDKQRARAQPGPGAPPPTAAATQREYELEKTIRKMQHKENKLAGARARAGLLACKRCSHPSHLCARSALACRHACAAALAPSVAHLWIGMPSPCIVHAAGWTPAC